ncbi:hypothetical protein QM012_002913 [Aureobasidium pullulans]|uniref:Uncharacterized protein n=1 Tax=Aureobasidium pullulans TaxID=5580 RepID=A0ABR0TBT0_AURPU
MTSIARHISTKALTRNLRQLGFETKLVQKFVEAPDNIKYATALLKSYSPPSHKPRKGRYNNLCLHKGARNQRKLIFKTAISVSVSFSPRVLPVWVVYDPLKHKPIFDKDTLMLTVRFAIFQPGNPRLIEYNTKTTSLRIRSSRIIVGQQIKYTANGPVLEPLDEEGSDSESKPTTTTKKGRKLTKTSLSKSGSDSELTELESDT